LLAHHWRSATAENALLLVRFTAWCAGPLRAKFSLLNQGKQWESRLAVISAWLLFISLRAQAVRASKFFGLLFDLVRAPPRASS
jgi:hypothetical protein